MDDDIVNISEINGMQSQEDSEIPQVNEMPPPEPAELIYPIETTKRSYLKLSIDKITAKCLSSLRSIKDFSSSSDHLAISILLFFDKPVPKSFPWEAVSSLFSNPGNIIHQIRKTPEMVQNKKILESTIRDILTRLSKIIESEFSLAKNSKSLFLIYDFLKATCDYYTHLWPETTTLVPVVKKKIRIPQTVKVSEQTELQQQINKEKKLIRDLQYKERLLKWDEERSIKKELKQEELRDIQREIIYSKSLEDEYKKKQAEVKSIEKARERELNAKARNSLVSKTKTIEE
ncbi:hypothetical protein SteCoe_4393 [Stentor coeruleus]|uniref:Uncharacterized protein n=1 Tax=Stentor coeruleus TaxID=5963 RepID=A0A1R2CUT6_9CILI|nr:hypothetical protein SteCoe_4393 [Stentor coeruleus]